MKARILSSSYVLNFMDVGFSSEEVNSIVQSKANMILETIDSQVLIGWEIVYVFRFNNSRTILLYTKEKSYPVEKYKEITTHIPIPTNDLVPWGVEQSQHIYDSPDHLNKILKNFICLDVDFHRFDNRQDYIQDCMQRAINVSLTEGFMVSGIRVKI